MDKSIILLAMTSIFMQASDFICEVGTYVNQQGEFGEHFKADASVSVSSKSITITVDGYPATAYYSETIQKGIKAYKTTPNLMIHYTNNNTFMFRNGSMAIVLTHCK